MQDDSPIPRYMLLDGGDCDKPLFSRNEAG